MNIHDVLSNLDQYIEKDRVKFEKNEARLDQLTGMMLFVRNDILPASLRDQFDHVPFSKGPAVLEKLGVSENISQELTRLIDDFQSKDILNNMTLKATEVLYKQTNDLLWLRENSRQEMDKENAKAHPPSINNDLDLGH